MSSFLLFSKAKNIEAIKLSAIGQRNKLSATKESQAKEERELKQKVLEKQDELERCEKNVTYFLPKLYFPFH